MCNGLFIVVAELLAFFLLSPCLFGEKNPKMGFSVCEATCAAEGLVWSVNRLKNTRR